MNATMSTINTTIHMDNVQLVDCAKSFELSAAAGIIAGILMFLPVLLLLCLRYACYYKTNFYGWIIFSIMVPIVYISGGFIIWAIDEQHEQWICTIIFLVCWPFLIIGSIGGIVSACIVKCCFMSEEED